MSTNIQWTDVVDNIITVEGGGWWCQGTSPGCDHCYSEKINQNSFFGGNHLPYSGQPPKLILKRNIIAYWKRMRSPKKHFVASMTDVFGAWVPREWQFEFLDGMRAAPLQTFQLLTKRPNIMYQAIAEWLELRGLQSLPTNIWVGTSVERNREARARIPWLLKIPAAVRFLSCEPLLESVNLVEWLPDLQWVIVGGESGPESRSCHIDWIRPMVRLCLELQVAIFVKQLGANPEGIVLKNRKGDDPDEWTQDIIFRQFPQKTAIVGGVK